MRRRCQQRTAFELSSDGTSWTAIPMVASLGRGQTLPDSPAFRFLPAKYRPSTRLCPIYIAAALLPAMFGTVLPQTFS